MWVKHYIWVYENMYFIQIKTFFFSFHYSQLEAVSVKVSRKGYSRFEFSATDERWVMKVWGSSLSSFILIEALSVEPNWTSGMWLGFSDTFSCLGGMAEWSWPPLELLWPRLCCSKLRSPVLVRVPCHESLAGSCISLFFPLLFLVERSPSSCCCLWISVAIPSLVVVVGDALVCAPAEVWFMLCEGFSSVLLTRLGFLWVCFFSFLLPPWEIKVAFDSG